MARRAFQDREEDGLPSSDDLDPLDANGVGEAWWWIGREAGL